MYFLNYDELERLPDEVSKMELRYILDYERINGNEDEELLRQVGVVLGFKKAHSNAWCGMSNPSLVDCYGGCAYYEK
jgi:hypothetical protein